MGMFSSILGNIKDSKKESENDKLLAKIKKMDLSDMRLYINGKLNEYKLNEYGLSEIVKRLIFINEETKHYYLQEDDQDSKKKKVFDLILLILKSKKVSIFTVELIQKFLEIYSDMIKKYDKENKQIYEQKIKESISIAIDKINFRADEADRMRTLK
jgi:hypothetical protein